MQHAAYDPLVFHLFFWSFFVLFMVLLLNIFVCLFVDAYCIVVEEARRATPMWTELYEILLHDVRALMQPATRFMPDWRLLDLLQKGSADLPSAGYEALREMVLQQLDHHKERIVQTDDPQVNISPYEVLEMVRGIDQAHDANELLARRSAASTAHSSVPSLVDSPNQAGDEDHEQVFLHLDDKQRSVIMNRFKSVHTGTKRNILNTQLEVRAALLFGLVLLLPLLLPPAPPLVSSSSPTVLARRFTAIAH